MMLGALTTQDAGDETQLAGIARMQIHQYLSEVPFIMSLVHEPRQTLCKPAVIDGSISISAPDLQLFVNKTFNEGLAIQAIVSRLVAVGARHCREKAGPLRDKSRWILPADLFPPEDFTVPPGEVSNV